MKFQGTLPPEAVNEKCVATSPPRWEAKDVLKDDESSKALLLDLQRSLGLDVPRKLIITKESLHHPHNM